MSDYQLEEVRNIIEGALLAAGTALEIAQMQALFGSEQHPDRTTMLKAIEMLQQDCESRGIELIQVASGFRLQVKEKYHEWVSRLFEEKPARYSRALLETLALIAYRQPVTRGEIEEVRGVAVSSQIIRTLQEREWIRVLGHRDVPGKPALYGTTRHFLDYFNLKSLDELPPLSEIRELDELEPELDLHRNGFSKVPGEISE